jgi:hypothetical protein
MMLRSKVTIAATALAIAAGVVGATAGTAEARPYYGYGYYYGPPAPPPLLFPFAPPFFYPPVYAPRPYYVPPPPPPPNCRVWSKKLHKWVWVCR